MRNNRYLLFITLAVAVSTLMSTSLVLGQTGDANNRVTINFKDVPIRSAIDMLFQNTKLNYTVESGIQGVVNAKLEDIPFTDALSVVLKTSGLTVRQEDGVYVIGEQKEVAPVMTPTPTPLLTEAVKVERKKVTEKISIGYADAYDISAILGGQEPPESRAYQFGGGSSSNGNSGSSFGSSSNSGSSFGSSSGSSFGSSNSGSSFGSSSGNSSSSTRW